MVASSAPLQGAAFYSKFPKPEHTPGDIWSGLVSDGTLSPTQLSGMVLTPACDLSNHKVEAITYLPIISLRQYFSTTAILPYAYKRMSGLCQSLGINVEEWMCQRYELPIEQDLSDFEKKVFGLSQNASSRVSELIAGVQLLRAVAQKGLVDVSIKTIQLFFGAKNANDMLQKMVKNSYSTDLHFLPRDGLPAEYSAVPQPSVVLFRYPSTISLQLLDHAIETPEPSWTSHVTFLETKFPGAIALKNRRPIKLGTLEPRFFADLLTRYVSLLIRLGAPSFDSPSISKMIAAIE